MDRHYWFHSRFNPRLRTGGDQDLQTHAVDAGLFQSTPPHGRRRYVPFRLIWDEFVSIHASAREATFNYKPLELFHESFNPRLRTGGDERGSVQVGGYTRFNPRLRTGGDKRQSAQKAKHGLFQSTPPHGRRRDAAAVARHSGRVSIHASAREATRNAGAGAPRTSRFNPRLRTGGDHWGGASGAVKM